MSDTIGAKLVQIAALRVDALRRLIALAPASDACGPIRAQLAEAEDLLRYRLAKFSGRTDGRQDDDAPPEKRHA